jgi:hypothetical protein
MISLVMRFPTAKMALQWSNLKNLTMRNEAHIKIEAWTPSVGSKSMLQSAWFRVSNIPADQRSIRTLAKVGGLVGKVIDVDEGSRYRYDYVRLKIACRDVTRVPRTAEGTLGMHLIDFGYEREIPEETEPKVLKSGIVVSDDQQPPFKKSKVDAAFALPEFDKDTKTVTKQNSSYVTGKQVQEMFWSAPPKIDFKPRSQTKLLADAQKAYNTHPNEGDGEKVHIPETFDDYDLDSESFSIKVQQLTGMEVNQGEKGDKGEQSKQVWFMKDVAATVESLPASTANDSFLADKICSDDITTTKPISKKPICDNAAIQSTLSPEVFIPDDNIVNTKESVGESWTLKKVLPSRLLSLSCLLPLRF